MKPNVLAPLAILAVMAYTFTPSFAAQPLSSGKPAFKPNPRLVMLGDNTVMDLGAFIWERPEGEKRSGSVTDFSGMVYDMHNNRILLFGGGHSATATDAIYSFDMKTLAWKALYTPTPAKFFSRENNDRSFWKRGGKGNYPRPMGRHTYDLLVVPEHRKEFFMLREGGYWNLSHGTNGAGGVFDFATARWTMIPTKEIRFGSYEGAAQYDPQSRMIIGLRVRRLFAFDPETRKGRHIMDVPMRGSGGFRYFPPNGKIYYMGKNKKLYEVNLNRTNLKNSTVKEFPLNGKEFILGPYDSKNRVFGTVVPENRFATFDPISKKYEIKEMKGGKPQKRIFYCQVYSPVDNVHIFTGKDPRDPKNKSKQRTWAYRWKK